MKRALLAIAAAWACLGTGPPTARAAEPDGPAGLPLPPPPANRVLDEAGLFARAPERLGAISRRLLELRRDRGWSVYLAIYPGLLGGSPEQQAAALHAAWNDGAEEGLVIVYESDTRLIAFGRPLEVQDAVEADSLGLRSRVAVFELNEALTRAVQRAADKPQAADQVESLTLAVAEELDTLLDRKAAPGRSLARLRFALTVVGGISVVALLALIAARLAGRSERRRRRVHRFPEVQVGMRLGAPYGGGRVTARSFRANGAAAGAGSGPPAGGGAG